MKKIAILHSGDLGNVSIGGVSQYIQEIIRYQKNYEVVLFGTCEMGAYKLGEKYIRSIDGKEYTFIPITDNSKRPLSIYYFKAIFRQLSKIEKCDVIYAQRMEYILPFVGRKSRKKTVMAVHGSGAYTKIWRGSFVAFFYNIFERISVNISNKVIVLQKREEFGVPYYKKRYKNNSDKIFYGKVPLDNKVFYIKNNIKKNMSKDIFSIIYLGRIDDNPKRVLLFPDIVENLLELGIPVKMTLIGDGPSMLELKEKVHIKNLKCYFQYEGKIEHGEQLTNLINTGNVAVILSSFEGICMSALECIACGTPVVATDVGDIKSYIKNGINGKIIPNDGQIVKNATMALKDIYDHGCELNDVYLEYSPDKMIDELKMIIEA